MRSGKDKMEHERVTFYTNGWARTGGHMPQTSEWENYCRDINWDFQNHSQIAEKCPGMCTRPSCQHCREHCDLCKRAECSKCWACHPQTVKYPGFK